MNINSVQSLADRFNMSTEKIKGNLKLMIDFKTDAVSNSLRSNIFQRIKGNRDHLLSYLNGFQTHELKRIFENKGLNERNVGISEKTPMRGTPIRGNQSMGKSSNTKGGRHLEEDSIFENDDTPLNDVDFVNKQILVNKNQKKQRATKVTSEEEVSAKIISELIEAESKDRDAIIEKYTAKVKELEGINEIDTANLLRNALLSAISVGTPGEVKVSKPEKSNDDVEQITFNSLMEGKLTEAEVLEIIKGAQSNHITALEMGLAKFRDARKKIDEQKKVDEQKKDDEKNIQGNGSDHQKKELALQEELDKTREELNKAKEELNRTRKENEELKIRKENEELKIRKENEELNKKDGDNGNPTPSSSSSTPSPTSENKNTSPREIRQ